MKETFDYKLINKLLDKYENSSLFKNTNIHQIFIKLNMSDELFKDYYSNKAYKYRDEIDSYIDNLSSLNLIKINKDSHIISSIELNLNNLDKAYNYVNRISKLTVYNEYLSLLNKFKSEENSAVLQGFIIKIEDLLNKKESIKKYFNSYDELLFLLNGIKNIEENKEEILLRNFSNKVFKDSKYLARHIQKFISIFNEFGNFDFIDDNEFLNYFNIYKNPTFTYIKGNIIFKINDQIINLSKLKDSISLTEEEINNLTILEINSDKILTIENLTTFYYFESDEFISIYLAGFNNSIKAKLLKKIYDFNTKISFYHFGDIDCNGFTILIHLMKETQIDIKPYLMNKEILLKYIKHSDPLTNSDENKLNLFLTKKEYEPFYEVIKAMLLHRCKLEQEAIEIY